MDFVPMSQAAGAPQVNRGTGFFGFVLGHEDKAYLEAITEVTFDLYNCAPTRRRAAPGRCRRTSNCAAICNSPISEASGAT